MTLPLIEHIDFDMQRLSDVCFIIALAFASKHMTGVLLEKKKSLWVNLALTLLPPVIINFIVYASTGLGADLETIAALTGLNLLLTLIHWRGSKGKKI